MENLFSDYTFPLHKESIGKLVLQSSFQQDMDCIRSDLQKFQPYMVHKNCSQQEQLFLLHKYHKRLAHRKMNKCQDYMEHSYLSKYNFLVNNSAQCNLPNSLGYTYNMLQAGRIGIGHKSSRN